jgi:tetraacyldisaccharide 4'-kinase
VILTAASALYGAAASRRRRWYAADPSRQRRLKRPVISIGNLSAGGSGKTPIVQHLARLLMTCGERPAILSRGYARPKPSPGVTVVSDGSRVISSFDTAGDEPLMLARALPGVPVVVCAERFLAGQHAEQNLSATVHLLDDGFQHLKLFRDVDLLVVSGSDLTDRVLPAGRLREPLSSAAAADALLVPADDVQAAGRLTHALEVETAFAVRRRTDAPLSVTGGGEAWTVSTGESVFAFAGVARPEQFFESVRAGGWKLAGTMAFSDHHVFTPADLVRVREAARTAGARVVMTTEKDAARLGADGVPGLPTAVLPLQASIEPADEFREWLLHRIRR